MGTGKTTVGAVVAERLDRALVDTDVLVMQSTGRTIQELFEVSVDAFRAAERDAVEAAASMREAVIATGGGAILDDANLETMRRSGTIVVLDAETDELIARIGRQPGERPLVRRREDIERIRDDRATAYRAAADHTIDTTGRRPDDVATEVIACIDT